MADKLSFRIVNKREVDAWISKMWSASTKTTPLMAKVGAFWMQQVDRQFRTNGAHMGQPWRKLEAKTVRTPVGTPRIAYGTDRDPKRSKKELAAYRGGLMARGRLTIGQTGPLPGYKGHRRYGGRTDPRMQKSGNFRRSWFPRTMGKDRVRIRSTFNDQLVAAIISGGGKNTRNVLVNNQAVRTRLGKLYLRWYRKMTK